MKHVRHVLLCILLTLQLGLGTAHATPLATFATTDLAHDLINFPIQNGIDYGPYYGIAGTLAVMDPERYLWLFGTEYVYTNSLIVYFEFLYRFIGDDGKTVVDDQWFHYDILASPQDYIDVGWVPDGGLPYNYAFDPNRLVVAFNSEYRGLQDNAWTIYGFRASVRHIYLPSIDISEPPTLLLVGIAALAGFGIRRKAKVQSHRQLPATGV